MLEGELMRKHANEKILYKTALGDYVDTSTSWATSKSISFTLSSTKIVAFRIRGRAIKEGAGTNWQGTAYLNIRVREGTSGNYIYIGSGQAQYVDVSSSVYFYCNGIVTLPAGTYNFDIQYSCYIANTAYNLRFFYLDEMRVGTVDISDLTITKDWSNSVSCPASTLTALGSETLTAPSQRAIRGGYLKSYKSNMIVLVYVESISANTVPCVLKNTGDSETTDTLGIKLYVDSVQADWKERLSDGLATSTYALGCLGIFYINDVAPADDYLIEVKANNTNISTARTVAYSVIYIVSPWIQYGDYNTCVQVQDVIPPASTIYAILEGLIGVNPTKYLRFGRQRPIPDDTVDWHQTTSSANIIEGSWNSTSIQLERSQIQAKGNWCILSYVGVDLS